MATKFSDFKDEEYRNVSGNGFIAGYIQNEVQKQNVRVSFSSLCEDIESKTSGTWSATQYYLDENTPTSREIFYKPSGDIDTEDVDFVSKEYMDYYTSGTLTENLVSANWDESQETYSNTTFSTSYKPEKSNTIGQNADPIALKSYVDAISKNLERKNAYAYSSQLPDKTKATKKEKSFIWIIGNEASTTQDNSYEYIWDNANNDWVKIGMMRNDFSGTLSATKYSSDTTTSSVTYNPMNANGVDWGDLASTAYVNYRASGIWSATQYYVNGGQTASRAVSYNPSAHQTGFENFVSTGYLSAKTSGVITANMISGSYANNTVSTGSVTNNYSASANVSFGSGSEPIVLKSYVDSVSGKLDNNKQTATSGLLYVSAKSGNTATNGTITTAWTATSYNPSANATANNLVHENFLTAVSSTLKSSINSSTSGIMNVSSKTGSYTNGGTLTTAWTSTSYNPSAHSTANNLVSESYLSAVSSNLAYNKSTATSGLLNVSSKTGSYSNGGTLTTGWLSTSYNPSAHSTANNLVSESYLTAVSSNLAYNKSTATSGILNISAKSASVSNNVVSTAWAANTSYNPSAGATASSLVHENYLTAVSSVLNSRIGSIEESKWQTAANNIIQPKDSKNVSATSGKFTNVSGTSGQFGSVNISSNIIVNNTGTAVMVTNTPSKDTKYFLTGTSLTAMGLASYSEPDTSKWSASTNTNYINPKDSKSVSATSGLFVNASATSGQFGSVNISSNVISNSNGSAVMVSLGNTTLASNTCYFLTGTTLTSMGVSAYTAPDSSLWSANDNNYILPKDGKSAVAHLLRCGEHQAGKNVVNEYVSAYYYIPTSYENIDGVAIWCNTATNNAGIKIVSKGEIKKYLGIQSEPISSTTWENFVTATDKEAEALYLVY